MLCLATENTAKTFMRGALLSVFTAGCSQCTAATAFVEPSSAEQLPVPAALDAH